MEYFASNTIERLIAKHTRQIADSTIVRTFQMIRALRVNGPLAIVEW